MPIPLMMHCYVHGEVYTSYVFNTAGGCYQCGMAKRAALNKHEPPPIPNSSRSIWELVIEDMNERNKEGIKKYGTPLQAHNGRNALVDAYQECLDLCVYLRQKIAEGDVSREYYFKTGQSLPELSLSEHAQALFYGLQVLEQVKKYPDAYSMEVTIKPMPIPQNIGPIEEEKK